MSKFYKSLLTENLTYKILAVTLAVFLWFFVTFKGQTETSIDIPIEFKNVPSDMEILRQSIKKVSVSISARERIIRELTQNNVRVVIDLSNVKIGENSLPITRSSIKLPRGTDILRIEPSLVKVVMDKKVQKTVPIKPITTGQPEKGFVVASVTATPSSIVIEGPQKELEKIRNIKTEPVDIEGIRENLNIQVKIDTEGRIFRTDTDTINLSITLRRR